MQLTTYEEWRACIEVACGIPLTAAFIRERLEELNDAGHPGTRSFENLYGTEHLQRTIAWFERAANEAS